MRSAALVVVVVMLAGFLSACPAHETGDLCDDDQDNDGDGDVDCADSDCFLAPACLPCGDGVLDDAEGCDDGNRTDGDGCSADCLIDGCGNGRLDAGEECDDGNVVGADGCDFRCHISNCGNGRFDAGEECDDGNALSGDGCSAQCHLETVSDGRCGNGVFDPGEGCDDGNTNDNDGCSHLCQFEFCGDGIVQSRLGEQCDLDAGVPENGRCQSCQLVFCDNGITEPERGEECDDGNQNFGDGCSGCPGHVDRCGDGFPGGGEQCDDGNLLSGDGCSSTCRFESCGDGIVQVGLGEMCDAPGDASCVSCTPQRVCTDGGALCFTVDREQPGVIGTVVGSATFDAVPRVFIGSAQNSTWRYDVVEGQLVNGIFTGSFGYSAMRSDDDDGRIIAGTTGGQVAFLDRDANLGFIDLALQARVLDVGAGDVGGGAGADVVAVAQGRLVAAACDGNASVATFTLPRVATRLVPAPVVGGSGVVLAGGTHVYALHVDGGGVTFVDDGEAAVDGDVADLARVDVDGDGVDDVVALTTAPDALVAFLLDGTGLPITPVFVSDAAGADHLTAADVDGDGAADLVTVGAGKVVVHLARDDFAALDPLPGPERPTRLDARDIDGDGDVDLFWAGAEFSPFGGFTRLDAVLFSQE